MKWEKCKVVSCKLRVVSCDGGGEAELILVTSRQTVALRAPLEHISHLPWPLVSDIFQIQFMLQGLLWLPSLACAEI